MAQQFKQSNRFEFKVEAAPSFMQLADGSFVKDGFTVNRRADNMAVLGKVTDRYGLVQNEDLIGAAEDAFSKAGMTDYSRNVIVTGEGERMYAIYNFKSHVRALKVGDEIGLRLTVQENEERIGEKRFQERNAQRVFWRLLEKAERVRL